MIRKTPTRPSVEFTGAGNAAPPEKLPNSICGGCYHRSTMQSGGNIYSTGSGSGVGQRGIPVEKLCDSTSLLCGIRRDEIHPGDRLEIHTRNSRYVVRVLGDGSFLVSGGWFQKSGLAGSAVGICGCTWGGRAIKTDWIAAPGLFLEFDNGVRTTRIQEVRWQRSV